VEYEVGSNRPYKVPSPDSNRRDYLDARLSNANKYWTTDLRLSTTNLPPQYGRFSVCDSEKQPILYVDRKGNPVSPVTYLSDPEPDNIYNRIGFLQPTREKTLHKYVKSVFIPLQTVAGVTTYLTNIDPSKIGLLQISTFTKKVVQFAEIPLDPIMMMQIIGGTTANVSSDSLERR
jgi:hypothetical protein